jgi:hypothetical protein
MPFEILSIYIKQMRIEKERERENEIEKLSNFLFNILKQNSTFFFISQAKVIFEFCEKHKI